MKIFSFIDSMKKFSREMPDDDILVQYTCTENTAILNCIRRSKRRYTKWITQRNHAFLSDTDTQIDTFMKGFWQQ